MAKWRGGGRELFFLAGPKDHMAVVTTDTSAPQFEFGSSQALFDTRVMRLANREYDVVGDGQRFVIATLIGSPTAPDGDNDLASIDEEVAKLEDHE